MDTDTPQLAVSRIFDAPRALVFRAFNDPDEGVMHVSGRLQEGVEPFETRFRIELHDEHDRRTRLEIRQWLPAHLAGPSNQGWLEAFEKLDATLVHLRAATADVEV